MTTYRERITRQTSARGARVILIDALPAALPGRLVADVVSACAFERVSLEFLLLSVAPYGGTEGALHPVLILRTAANAPEVLAKALDDMANRLLTALTGSGFAAHIVAPDQDESLRALLRDTARQQPSLCYAPPFSEGGYYAPNRQAACPPLSLPEWAGALVQCPGASLSLTLQCTSLRPAEHQLIQQSLAYFQLPALAASEEAAKCLAIFQGLAELGTKPLFVNCMALRAPGEMPRRLAALVHRCGLRQMPVTTAISTPDDLICDGGAELAVAAVQSCPPNPERHLLTPEIRRLAFLMQEDEIPLRLPLPPSGQMLPGMQVVTAVVDHQPIPATLTDPAGLPLGCRHENKAAVYLPVQQLVTHTSIVGRPGMGKTTVAIGLLYWLWKQGYPFLIVEPAKTEYRAMLDVIPELRIYTPGRTDVSPLSLNPFIPPKGVTLEQYLPSLITAFTAAFAMTRPLNVIFPDVLRTCYNRYGWRSNSTRDSAEVTHFGLQEFICVFREEIEHSGYDHESKSNLQSGGAYRLMSLINSNPALYDTDHTLPFDTLLTQPTLIELDAIDNEEQKSLLMTLILLNLSLVVRNAQVSDGRLKNVIMIDEAHVLLGARATGGEGDADPAGMTIRLLQNMVMVYRAYGTGLIFADQSPEKLTRSIVENTNVRIAMHLDSEQDRSLMANAMGLTSAMSRVLRQLTPGQAYFSCLPLNRPIRVQLPNFGKELSLRHTVSDEEIKKHMSSGGIQPPFKACAQCTACSGGCDHACRMEADFVARTLCDRLGASIADKEAVQQFVQAGLGPVLDKVLKETSPAFEDRARLADCVRMHVRRRLLLTGPIGLTAKDLNR